MKFITDNYSLFNENCLAWLKNRDDDSIDLMVTSPPYFNARDYSKLDSVQLSIERLHNYKK